MSAKKPSPTIDWQEARRLATQSEKMCQLIIAAVNGAAKNSNQPARTLRRGAAVAGEVIDLTAEWFGYTTQHLRKPGKPAALAWARQVAMYFCVELTEATTVEIGELLQRHHGCVGAACKVVANRLETEPRTKSDLENLRAHLNANLK